MTDVPSRLTRDIDVTEEELIVTDFP